MEILTEKPCEWNEVIVHLGYNDPFSPDWAGMQINDWFYRNDLPGYFKRIAFFGTPRKPNKNERTRLRQNYS